MFEMANLGPSKTGLSKGVVYISTEQGSHGCRVKYYPNFPDKQEQLTISVPQLRIVVDKTKMSDKEKKIVIRYVELNSSKIIKFWKEGDNWDDDEFDRFKKTLKVDPLQLNDLSDVRLNYK
jgi:hypothetical protein